ncbi:MAG: S8 family serine peptidase, partial [Oscillospiraceae bacterium]|nr:S8 family serine peptidase [Oscillospiraceae bacterium]
MMKTLPKLLRTTFVALVVAAIALGAILIPQAGAAGYRASYIDRLNGNVSVDFKEYLDSSVLFELPDNVSDDEDISVIITVDVANLMDAYEKTDKTMSFTEYALHSDDAADITKKIGDEKLRILKLLDGKNVKYSAGVEYNTVLSGFELTIKAGDFKNTCKALGNGEGIIVSEVYKAAETKLVENTVNVYETGIFKSGDSGYDGTGMVVAVLDTGLDSNHSAFSVKNFTSNKLGLTYSDVAAVVGQTTANKQRGGLTVDDVYINEKVPYGYDYADNDPDVYSTHNNHGTHVSGVIVGKDDTITGVAPNAQLVSMKVFSDIMDTARSTWILSALEDCVVLGVDVINMSLGTACGFSRETDEEILNGVYDKIRQAGISMVVAASNSYSSAYGSESNGNLGLTSNPDTGTVGSPGTYEGVMSVASINGAETPYLLYDKTIIYFDESNTGAAEENDFCATLLGDQESIEIEYIVIPGVGRSADYTGLDVKGKIALVRRGDNTFEEKAMIAEAQGAAGIIVYNNVSGDVKMNVGDAKLAVCSISQDDGEMLAEKGNGKLKISKSQSSGPFMSDFSSWGPTPSLGIKPEITAHGGNILSSVTGGGYDRLSGTSMACPNLSGVVILLRQYVVENFPEIANDNVKVSAMVNQLMMSTADIVYNTNGLPYAVRKQGAGLANLLNAIKTPAYITTYDKDGKAMDKTKLELGDDPEKTGVYQLSFTVTNFGKENLTYDIGYYAFTEGVSDTKTNSGMTTVTEEGCELSGTDVSIDSVEGGKLSGTKLTVNAGESADVTMTITLSDIDKGYLDASFENGMYVEGFVTLTATKGTEIDMAIPYLAFYGDWTKAPMFDRDYYETNADELDDAIAVEDKVMADAYASRPIGGLSEDYVSYLGSYYFLQDPDDMVISANRDYIALSNQEGTIHSLRFVWAGMLRAAAKIEITITDDTTGEVVFETVDTDVRKSYGDGGSIYPANIEIEFDTMDYNLANNSEYTVKLVGYMDYGNGGLETNEKNVFEFPLVVDFEAPTVSDVEFYYEYDKTLKKNRLYAKVGIYDNHFAMSSQLGYVTMGADENGNEMPEMKAFEQYMTPVFSQKNSTTYVTFELTDYIYDIKGKSINENSFVVTCYDYALNYATYEIGLPDEYVDFYFDGLEEGITLSPNEVYSMEPLVHPETEWAELLEFTSSRPSVVRVVNNKLVGVKTGNAVVKVRDPATNKSMTFQVTVLGKEDEGYRRYDKPVADNFQLTGYKTVKAYYMLANEDKLLGDDGDIRFFEGDYSLTMYPSESVLLNYKLDAYFPNDTTVEFESSNENIVKIDAAGNVTAVGEGFASVTIKVMQDGRSTYYSESVSVEVKDPYVTNGASLTHYYGNGGLVTIPEDLSLREIGNFAFSNFDYVAKTEEELAFDDE